MDEALAFSSFSDLGARLRSGALSSVALTEGLLARVSRHAELNAYAHVAPEAALAAARAADEEIAAGRWIGPLHGIPLAVKDAFYTTDMPTRCGSPVNDGFLAPHESTATRRLREAGAVLLGKHTLTEGVYADHHPSVRPPVNPYGSAYWTGTSSSGSGVAVSAGLAYGALGTDTGGSIRLPCASCGLVGIKPTWGRVSRHGVFPLAESLDHVGPIARSVEDAAALLSAIAGADPDDPTASIEPVDNYAAAARQATMAGLSVGVDRSFWGSRADAAVMRSMEAVVETIRSLGARPVEIRFPDPDEALRAWAVQCAVEAAQAHLATYPRHRDLYGERFAALLERGRAHTGLDLAEAWRVRRDFNGRMAGLFADIDLLLMPAIPVAGPSLTFMAGLGEDPAAILAIGPFTAPFDVCGYPTLSLPCGTSGQGIPLGCQFVARPFQERLLCQAGAAFQRATDWHRQRPLLPA